MRNVPLYTDPKLQDAVVQTLNTALLTTGHIEYAFPIAHLGYRKEGETYPSVYRNDGSFKNEMIFPDNKVKSFSFWEFVNAEDSLEGDGTLYEFNYVYWGNLQRLDNTKMYDFTSEIMQDIIEVLKANWVEDLEWETEDIFEEYTMYLEEKKQTLMRPNTGFKINFKVRGNVCD